MSCLEKFGNLAIPQPLLDKCQSLTENPHARIMRGISTWLHAATITVVEELLEDTPLTPTEPLKNDFTSVQVLSSNAQEMHRDEDLDVKYGILLIIEAPFGAELIQSSGPNIPVIAGDIVRIRYRHNHGLLIKENEQLLFIAIDYYRERRTLDDEWRKHLVSIN
ncbi:MAG: hypothetical protein RSG77_18300 [Hafnia sp.]